MAGESRPITCLVANKCDAFPGQLEILNEYAQEMAKELEIDYFSVTSAKTGEGVNDTFDQVRWIFRKSKQYNQINLAYETRPSHTYRF